MSIEEAIKKAIEGGWKSEGVEIKDGTLDWVNASPECGGDYGDADIFLDPQFWQCLGKAMGGGEDWKIKSFKFWAKIMEGKSAEEFFKELK